MVKSKSAYSVPGKIGKIERHIIVVWVDNEAGVLARIAGLFSGRGYNIESLAVAEVDKTNKSIVIQVTALRAEIDKLALDLKSLGLISTSRTGAVAMTKGPRIFN